MTDRRDVYISNEISTILRSLDIYEEERSITFPEAFIESEQPAAFIHWDYTKKYLAYIPASRFDRFNLNDYEDVYDAEKRKNLAVFNRSFRKVFRKCNITLTEEAERKLDAYFATLHGGIKFEISETPSEYYSQTISFAGNLGRSCMQGKDECFFQLYDDEPNIKLLVALVAEQMVGRALVFTDNNKYFLDRRYGINDNVEFALQEYALKQGWFVKSNNNLDDVQRWLHKDNLEQSPEVFIEIKSIEYDRFPYMDTFKYLSTEDSCLQTYKGDAQYKLNSTCGDYEDFTADCDHCSESCDEVHLNLVHDSNGYDSYVCDSCYDRYYFHCGGCCSSYPLEDSVTIHDGDLICQECIAEHYCRCDECDEIYHEDKILYLNNCEVSLCEDCRGV